MIFRRGRDSPKSLGTVEIGEALTAAGSLSNLAPCLFGHPTHTVGCACGIGIGIATQRNKADGFPTKTQPPTSVPFYLNIFLYTRSSRKENLPRPHHMIERSTRLYTTYNTALFAVSSSWRRPSDNTQVWPRTRRCPC